MHTIRQLSMQLMARGLRKKAWQQAECKPSNCALSMILRRLKKFDI
jgi:hypothetical protein